MVPDRYRMVHEVTPGALMDDTVRGADPSFVTTWTNATMTELVKPTDMPAAATVDPLLAVPPTGPATPKAAHDRDGSKQSVRTRSGRLIDEPPRGIPTCH